MRERIEELEREVAELRARLDGVHASMAHRAAIEQAKGLLVERLRIGPDAAFDRLARLSQRSNVKLSQVAAAVLAAAQPPPAGGLTGVSRPDSPGDWAAWLDPQSAERLARHLAAVPTDVWLVGGFGSRWPPTRR